MMSHGQPLIVPPPKKDQLIHDKLYEIPACTICIDQLAEDVVSLACGHCFHYTCINQHLQYRGSCPNCQKRAGVKELRAVIFPVLQNTKANDHLRSLLSSLNISERKQVQQLLREIKQESQKLQKLRGQVTECQKENKRQSQLIAKLKFELSGKQSEVKTLQKCNKEYIENYQNLELRYKQIYNSETRLRIQLERYQKQDKQYQQFKRFHRIMNQNSQEIVNFKLELEKKNTESAEMAKLFYDMLLLKNLDWLKVKEKASEHYELINEKDSEIKRHKITIEALRKELKDANDKKNAERRRYDELKGKYRIVLDKAKLKGVNDIPDFDDNSQGFATVVKSQPTIASTLLKPQIQLINQKPMFSGASTIGGLRKKDDKPRMLF